MERLDDVLHLSEQRVEEAAPVVPQTHKVLLRVGVLRFSLAVRDNEETQRLQRPTSGTDRLVARDGARVLIRDVANRLPQLPIEAMTGIETDEHLATEVLHIDEDLPREAHRLDDEWVVPDLLDVLLLLLLIFLADVLSQLLQSTTMLLLALRHLHSGLRKGLVDLVRRLDDWRMLTAMLLLFACGLAPTLLQACACDGDVLREQLAGRVAEVAVRLDPALDVPNTEVVIELGFEAQLDTDKPVRLPYAAWEDARDIGVADLPVQPHEADLSLVLGDPQGPCEIVATETALPRHGVRI